jgi:anti-sigma regulatory factor (Ser/Thr protein kinase)
VHGTHFFDMPRDRSAGAAIRRRLDDLFAGVVSAGTLADLRLAASELVSNAVIHGEGDVSVRIEAHAHRIRLEVIDHGHDNVPEVRPRSGNEHGGWGLQIIERLSSRWGVFEGTTHVWCDIPLDRRA